MNIQKLFASVCFKVYEILVALVTVGASLVSPEIGDLRILGGIQKYRFLGNIACFSILESENPRIYGKHN